ncbi:MAG TPA: hypothetical protein VLD65_11845 [Anaerolineales bacterium]|nr:hypothetical protein [Anaerolineales bacterium]
MVPAIYSTFFTTMAVVGATLFGLIFVAISIAPEYVIASTAQLDRQIKATAAYIALLNPLMISLFALVPYQWIGIAASILSWVGILNTLTMLVTLIQNKETNDSRLRNITLILISFIVYGFEAYVAIQIARPVFNEYWLSILADLLIFITLFGIIRAWELIGIRQFRFRDWFGKLIIKLSKSAKERSKVVETDEYEKSSQS